MAKPQQTASELGRTLAGQWTKSEKRERASREIMESNQRIKAINKAIMHCVNQFLYKPSFYQPTGDGGESVVDS
jgi:hypothetical protein